MRGISLQESLEQVDCAEMALWEEYWRHEWNNPGRLEHYVMANTLEVRRPNLKNPNSGSLEQMKLKFKFDKSRNVQDEKTLIELNKQRWFSMLGGPPGEATVKHRGHIPVANKRRAPRPNQP